MLPRILVLVNVFLSVGLMAWALTLASNRLDWVDSKTDTGTVKGQITLLKEEIDRAAKGAGDLSRAYVERTKSLADAEAFRTGRRTGYADRLKKARDGQFLKPVMIAGSDGFVDLTRDGGPEPGPGGKPLRGTEAVQADIQRELRAADRALAGDAPLMLPPEAELEAALADDARYQALTEKLGFSDLRKLQAVLADRMADADKKVIKQKDIRKNLRDEAQQLAAVRVNWRAQLQDLLDRQRQLNTRLMSLSR
jgi:hypothetical protein